MKAGDIIELLKQKHHKDVCVEQCKIQRSWNVWDGSTAQSPLIDLWVLPRKWKDGEPIVYEVKVSRGDLFGDQKYTHYWTACNWFYFAVPNGLVTQDEMDQFQPQCGFIEVFKNGNGMRVKRKPAFMPVPIDPSVYRYVLMWRSKIADSRFREFN